MPTISQGMAIGIDFMMLNATNQAMQTIPNVPTPVKTLMGIGTAFASIELGRKAIRWLPPQFQGIANAGVDIAGAGLVVQQIPNIISLFQNFQAGGQ